MSIYNNLSHTVSWTKLTVSQCEFIDRLNTLYHETRDTSYIVAVINFKRQIFVWIMHMQYKRHLFVRFVLLK